MAFIVLPHFVISGVRPFLCLIIFNYLWCPLCAFLGEKVGCFLSLLIALGAVKQKYLVAGSLVLFTRVDLLSYVIVAEWSTSTTWPSSDAELFVVK